MQPPLGSMASWPRALTATSRNLSTWASLFERSVSSSKEGNRVLPDCQVTEQSRILIVDDVESNIAFLQMTLQAAGFQNIVSVDSGAKAIDECLKNPPDLLMLDLHMPEVD